MESKRLRVVIREILDKDVPNLEEKRSDLSADPTRRPGSCLLGYAMCSRRGLEPFVLLRIDQQNEISEANFKTRREIR